MRQNFRKGVSRVQQPVDASVPESQARQAGSNGCHKASLLQSFLS